MSTRCGNTAAPPLFGGRQLVAVLCGIVVGQMQVAFTADAKGDFLKQFGGSVGTPRRRRKGIARALIAAWTLLALRSSALALSPSLEISQYAHYAWTVRDGFALGNVYAIAQTPDGYLWLGTEFGLFRFDGVRFLPWQPPAGQQLPDKNINSLLVTRDGSLWIGTFAGLVILRDGRLARPPALDDQFVASLFEDGEGTVWAASLESGNRGGRLCAIRSGGAQCSGEDRAFGRAVWAIYEDGAGTLWAGAESGVWRLRPGPPQRYRTSTELIGLNRTEDGELLMALHGAGLRQLVGDKVQAYPIRDTADRSRLFAEHEVNANRLLRDRDGGLWIGTVDRGLIHLHDGRADVFRRSDGLSGDVILSLFEDREGNVWVASTGGLDRFRELPVTTISVKQGLSSDATNAVLAATDGGIWIGASDALTRLKNGETTIFRKGSGLPDAAQSLYQDDRGRIWVSTRQGLAHFTDGRFVGVKGVPVEMMQYVSGIAGDSAGNLWLSEQRNLLHLQDNRLVEQIPWSELGRQQQANNLLAEQGGVWLGFWVDGGVWYLKNRQRRASYTVAEGLGQPPVQHLQRDRDGAVWAATQNGGVSRIKDGRVATLTSRNDLPCDGTNWSIEDDQRSLWLYMRCGLVRIARTEVDAWIADPKRRVATTVWDATDGVRLRSSAASGYSPRVTKSADGRLWFVTGEGIQVVDPRHLVVNEIPPPVRIEQVTADRKPYDIGRDLRLASPVRDLRLDFTALSLVAPEKVRFRYKLEGYDDDWQEAGNRRQAFYTNLPPRPYRFRVLAANNSGVWNETGAVLDFSIAPAMYQTNWFRALCAAFLLGMLWTAWRMRLRQLGRQLEMTLNARVAERTRIARDLHDTLLQDFQGVLLLFDRSLRLLPEQPAEAKKRLETALQQAVRAITDARNAVQGLRLIEEEDDLVASLTTIRDEFASDEPNRPQVHIVVDGTPRPLKPIVRAEVYRIADEGVRNAYRHAVARQITLAIGFDARQFRLRVRDDGRGIDEQVFLSKPPAGHFGLRGMRERAELVGGQLAMWSKTGSGTQIQLTIPAAAAYADSPAPRAFWRRLFRYRNANRPEAVTLRDTSDTTTR
jgi:signal transduction histidine kinase/ligand-binding sensor domain-containing protein